NTGMSMFLIGMIAAKIRLRDFLDKEILWFCAVRLALIPLITFAFSKLIGADPLSAGMSTILVAMPAGGTTAVLAAKYGRNPEFAVGCVATSTLLSLIAIPIWSMFV
ncbi:MAG: AEC family transporter, partial [Firmicutes bacterium]|nr:AEC family transporter [Bacillota bacterium]